MDLHGRPPTATRFWGYPRGTAMRPPRKTGVLFINLQQTIESRPLRQLSQCIALTERSGCLFRPEAAERHVLARLAEEPAEGPLLDGHRLSPGWHRPDVATFDLLPDRTFRRREEQLAVCLIDLAESDLQRPSDGRLPNRLRLQSKVCAA